ncbi:MULTISPECIES: hypothetical protein [Chryseobacterium]|uniref:hypothetical protein n=1 Tax=Chryseobacterium TaxID=59732 RepID=UPI0028A2BE4A|nr:hypothetical protein [Chryseobacterium sp.]
MGKLKASSKIIEIIDDHLEKYKDYNDFSATEVFHVYNNTNTSNENYYTKCKFKINETKSNFSLKLEFYNGHINPSSDYDEDKILPEDKMKIDKFYEYFRNINKVELTKIYESIK